MKEMMIREGRREVRKEGKKGVNTHQKLKKSKINVQRRIGRKEEGGNTH